MNEQVTNTSVVKSIIYNLIDYKIRRNVLTLNILLDSFFMKWIIDKVDTIYIRKYFETFFRYLMFIWNDLLLIWQHVVNVLI